MRLAVVWPRATLWLSIALAAEAAYASDVSADVSFTAVHTAERARNHILATFRTPDSNVFDDATEAKLVVQFLYTQELEIIGGGANNCTAVVAAVRLVIQGCSLSADGRSIDLSLFEPLQRNSTYSFELEVGNRAALGLRFCERSSILERYFVKTGGTLNETSPPGGSMNRDLDRCCRQVDGMCYAFDNAASCEAAKGNLACLPCAPGVKDAGCPRSLGHIAGYDRLRESVQCPDLIPHGSVATVEACAHACSSYAGNCTAFTLRTGGLCFLTLQPCCPDSAVKNLSAVSYFKDGTCGSMYSHQWHAALTLHWRNQSALEAVHAFPVVEIAAGISGTPQGLLPMAHPSQQGSVASFSAVPMPDVGLLSAGSGAVATIELEFQLGPRGEGPGDVLLFAPLPILPWDFGVPHSTPLLASAGATDYLSTVATIMETDLPDVLSCTWHRIGNSGGANSILCVGAEFALGLLALRSYRIILQVPVPHAAGFSTDWLLYVQGPDAASVATQSDVLGFMPVGASIEMIMSAVQLPQSLTTILVSFQLGLWSSNLGLTVTAPDYVLRGLQSCTPADGWPFPVASKILIEGTSCRFEGMVTGEPSTTYQLQLASENRGVMPGTKGVFTLSIRWAQRHMLVSAKEFYNLVSPFSGAGAILPLSVRGAIGPVIIYFETAAAQATLYEGCQHDMELQVTLMEPLFLVIRSTTGQPLSASDGPADCGEVLVETYSDESNGFPAPASCRWDTMTSRGHFIAISFNSSAGYAALQSGQRMAIVFFAELAGVDSSNTISSETASSSPLTLVVLCGHEAVEAAQLELNEPGPTAVRVLEHRATGAALSLVGNPVADQASQSMTFALRIANLQTSVRVFRVLVLPLFGFGFQGSSVNVRLKGWAGGGLVVDQVVSATAKRVGEDWAPLSCLDIPHTGASVDMVELLIRASSPQGAGLGWTGFAPHPYVFVQLFGTGGFYNGDNLLLNEADPGRWLVQEPSLSDVYVLAQSQMGGALHRVDMLLRLGFLARGIKVTVRAPAGITIVGHGPPPATTTYLIPKGNHIRYPQMRVDVVDATYGGNTAALPVTQGIMWPTTTYAYSLQVANPARLLQDFEWLVTVEYSQGYAVAGGAAPPLRSVAGRASRAQGAFAVVPALQACSISPLSMELGAKNAIQVFFSVSGDKTITVDYSARPFIMKLFAPPAFRVVQPVEFRQLVNLPPLTVASACIVERPPELHCRLPSGFAFVSGATYAFETSVQNPVVTKVEDFVAVRQLYTSTWALRLEYSQLVFQETTSLYSLCEGIPQSPLRGSDGSLAFPEPFSLYIAETQPLFFGVSLSDLLPYDVRGRSSQVAVTFQPTSAQLPTETLLLVTAPVGWQWDRSSSIDGKSSAVRRGTTRDLPMAPLLTKSSQRNLLRMRLTEIIIEGQVYGFLSRINVPGVEADVARGGATANVWKLELLRDDSGASFVSDGHFEAVARSFAEVRIRRVASCMVLPMTPDVAAETDIIFGFQIASPVNRRGYIKIRAPPHVKGVEPCADYFSRFVKLPAALPKSGYVYPEFVALPAAVSCSWVNISSTAAELQLINLGEEPMAPGAYLSSVRISMPDAQKVGETSAAHRWEISTHNSSHHLSDAPCTLQQPFRIVTPSSSLTLATVLDTAWYVPEEPLMLIGFRLAREATAPIILTLRAPFGFRFADISCGKHINTSLEDMPEGIEALASTAQLTACIAGGGAGELGERSFAPETLQPAPLLEGILSFQVARERLEADKDYAFGVSLVSPIGVPLQKFNTWYLNVADQTDTFAGQDLMRITKLEIAASFPGFALDTTSLPYNDVTVSFEISADFHAISTNYLVLSVPDVFIVSMELVTCAPFSNFSTWGADLCKLPSDSIHCFSTTCLTFQPDISAAIQTANMSNMIWLKKDTPFQFQIRVQNPASCDPCTTTWSLRLQKDNVEWSSTAEGFALIGGIGELTVQPTHQLGGVRVLIAVRIAFTGTLRLGDAIKLLIPAGWKLDPEFCMSPLGVASIIGLNAPPHCTDKEATLTVYEMDLPPLHQLLLRLNLEATAPLFKDWKHSREEWLTLLGLSAGSSVPTETQVPLEFAVVVERGIEDSMDVVDEGTSPSTNFIVAAAAAKVQAYELLPNMAQGAELQVSTVLLSYTVALRVFFVPSTDLNVKANSVLLRASLPYDFTFCQLLWEEEPERAAVRSKSDPAFMFAGEPRCSGGLNEATLSAVLLDTANKRPVTLYVTNFTAPAPPYAAAQSSWEIVLQRSRGGLAPIPLDTALGVRGSGAFGEVIELPSTAENGGFASNYAFGALNTLTFKFYITVQLLLGAVVRVIAPPSFIIDPFTFRGVTRHFARQWAASDVWLSSMTLQEYYGMHAPSGIAVEVLQVRALTDSAIGEELHFEVAVRNPADSLRPELQVYNRWILETLDVSSDLVVNSNRMTWRTFNPMPAFVVIDLVSRDSIVAFSKTSIDMTLTVDAAINVSTIVNLTLEIIAPDSFIFDSACFGSNYSSEPVLGSEHLPFAATCQGIGRLALIKGMWPSRGRGWVLWPKDLTYGLTLKLKNGDSTRADVLEWGSQLRAETMSTSTTVVAQSTKATIDIGPAQAILPTNVRLVKRMTTGQAADMPSVMPLQAGARVLVIERVWAERRGLSVGDSEVAVLLSDGSFGVSTMNAVQNVPADDAVPTSSFKESIPLVRLTQFQGYSLESILAAVGYGSYEPGLSGIYMVVVIQLAVSTGFPLAGVRVAAPPHMASRCWSATMGNLPFSSESSELGNNCRVVRDALTSTLLFFGTGRCDPSSIGADTTSCYLQKEHFWFSAPMDLLKESDWKAERQTWEVGVVDRLGQMRFVTSNLMHTPQRKSDSTLLFFRVATSNDGVSDTEFGNVLVSFTIGFRLKPKEDFGDGIDIKIRAANQVPFYEGKTTPFGECLEAGEESMFREAPGDRMPRRADDCRLFRAPFTPDDAKPAEGNMPAHYEWGFQIKIMLWSGCRRPNPPCADFFGVQYEEEELIARDPGLERQLAEGLKDIPAGAPRQHVLSLALSMGLTLGLAIARQSAG